MKKVIASLTTLSVLGIAPLAHSSETNSETNSEINMAWFSKPNLEISGKITGMGAGASVRHQPPKTDKVSFASKGDLLFNIKAMTQGGTEYGGIVALDVRRDKAGGDDLYKSVYAYFSSPEYGTWQIGDLDSALEQVMVDGSDIMGGTGGFDGDMFYFATPTAGVFMPYMTAAYNRYATKIVYKSPVVHGLQLAASYTPHSALWGTMKRMHGEDFAKNIGIDANASWPSLGRIFEAALSYGFSLGDVGVNLYAGGAIGNPNVSDHAVFANKGLHPVKVWQLGMLLDWQQFQFAAGVLNQQRSMMRKDELGNAGTAYNAALSYTTGRHTIAVGYLGSTRRVLDGRAKGNVGSLTYECKLAPGWTVFGEANYFSTTNTVAYLAQDGVTKKDQGYLYQSGLKKNNSGGVFLLGTTIRF